MTNVLNYIKLIKYKLFVLRLDTNTIHEPPRRVLVSLPTTNITLSDYLFPGEGPQEARTSLLDMLDISVNEEEDIKDIEGQAGKIATFIPA